MRRTFANAFDLFSNCVFWLPTFYLTAWSIFPEVFMGFSYTTVITLNSFASLFGSLIGLPTILWIAQSWRLGTGLCSGRKGFDRAYPIVVSLGAAFNSLVTFPSLFVVEKNYAASLAITFLVALGGAADACLSQQMMLMVLPTTARSSAFALSRLTVAVIGIPAAQLVAVVSDVLRGSSTLPLDRFRAYQLGLLCSSSFLVVSALCFAALVYFFPLDCKRAQEEDERSALIDKPKPRSESMIESIIRSRATTVNS
ncbi:hypothetical protein PMAYCL1PPCAC_22507, partial [Pristionchus mayeri]